MIEIIITDQIVGQAWLCEKLGGQGRKKLVPTYKMFVLSTETPKDEIEFAVTRDTSDCIFGGTPSHFDSGGECPPCAMKQPYHGVEHRSERVPYGIRLFEPWCEDKISLRGTGKTVRTGILIHQGPARSEGCFTIAGGERTYRSFVTGMRSLIKKDNTGIIYVTVHAR